MDDLNFSCKWFTSPLSLYHSEEHSFLSPKLLHHFEAICNSILSWPTPYQNTKFLKIIIFHVHTVCHNVSVRNIIRYNSHHQGTERYFKLIKYVFQNNAHQINTLMMMMIKMKMKLSWSLSQKHSWNIFVS